MGPRVANDIAAAGFDDATAALSIDRMCQCLRWRHVRAQLIAIAILGSSSIAGALRAQSLPELSQFQLRRFGLESGLPAVSVTGLAQTQDGYLYVAGFKGLARYNGQRFQRVPLPGLRSERLLDLHRDALDRLWLRTGDDEIAFLERGELHVLPAPPVVLGNSVEFTETSDSLLWLGTDHGLLRIDPRSKRTPFQVLNARSGLPSDTVLGVYSWSAGRHVVATRRGFRWLATAKGLATPIGDVIPAMVPSGFARRGVVRDSRGLTLYAPGPNGTLLFDGSTARVISGSAVQHLGRVRGIDTTRVPNTSASVVLFENTPGQPYGLFGAPQPDGSWLLFPAQPTDNTSHVLQLAASTIDTLSVRIDGVQAVLRDQEGSVWVGTSEGLVQMSPSRLRFARAADDSLLDFTTALLETRDSALWIGTWTHGLFRYANGRRQQFTGFDARYGDHVRALFESSDGTVWVGMVRSYAKFRNGRLTSRVATDEGGQVAAFAETRDGTVWIGSRHQLYASRAGATRAHHPTSWIGRHIWSMHADINDDLWIGTEKGLARLTRAARDSVEWPEETRGVFVVSMFEQTDGTMWFGTYEHGLIRRRNGRFTSLTTADGLHDNGIWSLVPDDQGGLWMSSDHGLLRASLSQLNAVADERERGIRQTSVAGIRFTEFDGLPSEEANRASPAGIRMRSGLLLFNNRQGLVAADPTWALAMPSTWRVLIEQLSVDGDSANLLRSAESIVPPGTHRVSIGFAATTYVSQAALHFRYRLDPFDPEWNDAAQGPFASYTELPPGRYTFRVESGRGSPVNWASGVATASIVVLPTLWQSTWWRLTMVGAILSLVTLAYRYRVRRLREVEGMRLRIASDLHDDIGASLGSITLLSDMIAQDAPSSSATTALAERVRHAASEASTALRDVIWVVDPSHRYVNDLAERIVSVATAQLPGHVLRFDVPEQLPKIALGMPMMRMVLLIAKEATHNVAKHAQATACTVGLRIEADTLILSVEDNGKGMMPGAATPGYGIANMRRRADQIGALLVVQSSRMGGVQVELRLPMRSRARVSLSGT